MLSTRAGFLPAQVGFFMNYLKNRHSVRAKRRFPKAYRVLRPVLAVLAVLAVLVLALLGRWLLA
ncbi:hypothetical protein D9M73_215180 [compost metagenome]